MKRGSKFAEAREAEEKEKAKAENEERYKQAEIWFDRYRICFNTKAGKRVLEDLRRFINSSRTTAIKDEFGRVDPIGMGIREGMRKVENHINGRLTQPMRIKEGDDEDE